MELNYHDDTMHKKKNPTTPKKKLDVKAISYWYLANKHLR